MGADIRKLTTTASRYGALLCARLDVAGSHLGVKTVGAGIRLSFCRTRTELSSALGSDWRGSVGPRMEPCLLAGGPGWGIGQLGQFNRFSVIAMHNFLATRAFFNRYLKEGGSR